MERCSSLLRRDRDMRHRRWRGCPRFVHGDGPQQAEARWAKGGQPPCRRRWPMVLRHRGPPDNSAVTNATPMHELASSVRCQQRAPRLGAIRSNWRPWGTPDMQEQRASRSGPRARAQNVGVWVASRETQWREPISADHSAARRTIDRPSRSTHVPRDRRSTANLYFSCTYSSP